MFRGASKFNSYLFFENTSFLIDMSYMFENATSFDKPLNFNTIKVTNMSHMFENATSFDKPLNFDTERVYNMSYMFYKAINFDQLLDFDVRRLIYFDDMFENFSVRKKIIFRNPNGPFLENMNLLGLKHLHKNK
jgi:hypothetical protein